MFSELASIEERRRVEKLKPFLDACELTNNWCGVFATLLNC